MNQETRDTLNSLIKQIKSLDLRLESLVKYDTPNFDKDWGATVDKLNDICDEFFLLINKVWYRNLDKSVQKSVNYYLKKGGFVTRTITAII